MMRRPLTYVLATVTCSAALTVGGCAFHGLNSLPLPGAVGRGPDAVTYHVEVPNVATLESNSPVMINDVVVGSVGPISVQGWHADVEISVKHDAIVPANAVATVEQTSLLGSMHLALDPPPNEKPTGRMQPGAIVGLNQSSTYNFVGLLDRQHDNIIALTQQLNRVAGRLAGQRDVLDRALHDIPKGLEVLISERPRLTDALRKLGQFSDTATGLVADAKADLVSNLKNLQPTMRALADVGPDFDAAVAYATVFPYGANNIDRIVRGDYINLFATFDITYPRIKRTLLLGTRWGDSYAKLIPAPGEPWYLNYSYDPLSVGIAPPPAAPTSPNTAQPPPAPEPPPNPLTAPQGGR